MKIFEVEKYDDLEKRNILRFIWKNRSDTGADEASHSSSCMHTPPLGVMPAQAPLGA